MNSIAPGGNTDAAFQSLTSPTQIPTKLVAQMRSNQQKCNIGVVLGATTY